MFLLLIVHCVTDVHFLTWKPIAGAQYTKKYKEKHTKKLTDFDTGCTFTNTESTHRSPYTTDCTIHCRLFSLKNWLHSFVKKTSGEFQ